MSEEEELNEMISDLYNEYISGGFDFSSSDTFDEVFKRIFTDAVNITLKVLEEKEEVLN